MKMTRKISEKVFSVAVLFFLLMIPVSSFSATLVYVNGTSETGILLKAKIEPEPGGAIQFKPEPLGVLGREPSISQDGKFLLYISTEGGRDIFVIYDLEKGKETIKLKPAVEGRPGWPVLSADGKNIIATLDTPEAGPFSPNRIISIPVTGGAAETILDGAKKEGQSFRYFKPQFLGERLVISASEIMEGEERFGGMFISEIDTIKKTEKKIYGGNPAFDENGVPLSFKASMPATTPGGELFFIQIEGHTDSYLVLYDRGKVTRLTKEEETEKMFRTPSASSDGSLVALVGMSSEEGTDIFLFERKTGKVRQLTFDGKSSQPALH